jgi:type I restriction enzyme, S subunit
MDCFTSTPRTTKNSLNSLKYRLQDHITGTIQGETREAKEITYAKATHRRGTSMSLATPRKGYKSVPWLFGKEIEIPEEWETIKLGHLFDIGSSKRVLESQWKTEGVPFYRGREITAMSNYGKVKNKLFISEDLYEEYSSKYGVPKSGDILITAIGTIGNSYIVKEHEKFYFKDASVLWLNKTSNVESKFVDFWFKSERFFQQLDKGNGSTVDSLTIKKLQSIRSLLPTSLEQQKIATILSNVDSLIESTGKVITNSKKVKTGLMQKLLTRGIGHTKFKKITMGLRYMIETYPEEWIISTLGENAELQRGKFGHRPRDDPEFYGGKYPFIQTGDVEKSNKYILTFSQTLNEKGLKVSKIFPKGIIVITIAANIGSTSITTFDTCFPDSLIGISTNSMDTEFLEYFMNTRKNYLNAVATTSAQKNINYETLKPLKIPVPPLPEQQKIATILSNIDSKITSQEQYKEKLEKLKKSLMQKLLTGEVRV